MEGRLKIKFTKLLNLGLVLLTFWAIVVIYELTHRPQPAAEISLQSKFFNSTQNGFGAQQQNFVNKTMEKGTVEQKNDTNVGEGISKSSFLLSLQNNI